MQSTAQTKPTNQKIHTQTELTIEEQEIYEYYVSRVDPSMVGQEDIHPSVEQPTMTSTHAWELQQQTQLEASHEMITEGIMATVNQEANTEIEKDTLLYRKNIQEVLGLNVIAAATRTDRYIRSVLNFVEKSDCEAIRLYIGTTHETSYTYETIAC